VLWSITKAGYNEFLPFFLLSASKKQQKQVKYICGNASLKGKGHSQSPGFPHQRYINSRNKSAKLTAGIKIKLATCERCGFTRAAFQGHKDKRPTFQQIQQKQTTKDILRRPVFRDD